MGVKSLMGDIRGMGSNLRRFRELISPPLLSIKGSFQRLKTYQDDSLKYYFPLLALHKSTLLILYMCV